MLNTRVIAQKFHESHKFLTKTSLKILNNDLLLAIVVAIILLLIGVVLGYENVQKIPITHATTELYQLEPKNKLSFMSNWDGPIYINIAKNGYSKVSLANFFPLYPLLINIVNKLISSSLYSALLVAWVSLIGAIYFYLKVVKQFLKIKLNSEAVRALLLFILFPSAVFMLASFTESLFAFLSLAAIYYAMKNRYLVAAIFGMFATATRPTGVFLILLVALILFENRTKLLKIYTGIIIGMLGILSYMIFLYIKYGNPMEFVVTQKGHVA